MTHRNLIANRCFGSISMAGLFCLVVITIIAGPVQAADHAAVLLYHRFGESRYANANTTVAQLRAHLSELAQPKYSVRALAEIVQAFQTGTALADRTVALTVDDAFISFYRRAWPWIKKSGLPITLFIATDAIDQGRPDYMSWAQVRELVAAGVVIGSQTKSHPHLPAVSPEKLLRELNHSNQRFLQELGRRPNLIAYPYGEYGLREKAAAQKAGFVAGFGQQSGIAHAGGDRYGLPRFAMNEKFGALARVRVAAQWIAIAGA